MIVAEGKMTPLFKPHFEAIAIGASAGGLPALTQILAPLPADFPVPILVVQHVSTREPSHLALVLSRKTKLAVHVAESGQAIQPGSVYVAPPDRHLLIQPCGALLLSDQPKIHFVRPSVTSLFESLAVAFETRVIGVVLSGTGKDGSEGVRAIKNAGGRVLVEDRKTAQFFGMPSAAIATGCYDFVLPVNKIAAALLTLTMVPNGADLFRVFTPLPFLDSLGLPESKMNAGSINRIASKAKGHRNPKPGF